MYPIRPGWRKQPLAREEMGGYQVPKGPPHLAGTAGTGRIKWVRKGLSSGSSDPMIETSWQSGKGNGRAAINRTHTHTQIHLYTLTYTQTYTHTDNTLIYTHSYTYTHTQPDLGTSNKAKGV